MVVLVTGAGAGIGLLTAVEAARRGHIVYAGLRRLDADGALREAAGSLDVRPLQLDVTDSAQREAAVAQIEAAHGAVDALVNNAGVALGGFLEDVEEDELRRVLEVNLIAPWALTRRVLPGMRARGSGRVIMVSSVSGLIAMPGLGTYAASKFGLEGLSEAWRTELAPFGITLSLIEPGPYKTDIWGRNRHLARKATDPDSPYAELTGRLEAAVERISVSAAGDPMDVARAICDQLTATAPLRTVLGRAGRMRLLAKRVLPGALWERLLQRAAFGR